MGMSGQAGNWNKHHSISCRRLITVMPISSVCSHQTSKRYCMLPASAPEEGVGGGRCQQVGARQEHGRFRAIRCTHGHRSIDGFLSKTMKGLAESRSVAELLKAAKNNVVNKKNATLLENRPGGKRMRWRPGLAEPPRPEPGIGRQTAAPSSSRVAAARCSWLPGTVPGGPAPKSCCPPWPATGSGSLSHHHSAPSACKIFVRVFLDVMPMRLAETLIGDRSRSTLPR